MCRLLMLRLIRLNVLMRLVLSGRAMNRLNLLRCWCCGLVRSRRRIWVRVSALRLRLWCRFLRLMSITGIRMRMSIVLWPRTRLPTRRLFMNWLLLWILRRGLLCLRMMLVSLRFVVLNLVAGRCLIIMRRLVLRLCVNGRRCRVLILR